MSRITAGLEIAGARVRAGLTQVELADKAGVSASKVSRLESAKGTPNPDTVVKVLQTLNIPAGPWLDDWGTP